MTTSTHRAEGPVLRTLRRRAAVTAALVVALVGLVPAVATADDDVDITPYSSSQCTSGRFCLWSGTGYSGSFWSTASTGVQNTTITTSGSLWNRSSVAVRVYSGTSASGVWVCYAAGAITSSTSVGSASVRTMTSSTC
ncbi:MAG TPA: peptidase inhibitor family I36 protein [Cellulomonas sp.]